MEIGLGCQTPILGSFDGPPGIKMSIESSHHSIPPRLRINLTSMVEKPGALLDEGDTQLVCSVEDCSIHLASSW
jgi:hypothetical protein